MTEICFIILSFGWRALLVSKLSILISLIISSCAASWYERAKRVLNADNGGHGHDSSKSPL